VAVTYRYYPTTDVDSGWGKSGAGAPYEHVDEVTPSKTDYLYSSTGAAQNGDVVSFTAEGSSEDFANCPMVPWLSFGGFKIEAYCYKYGSGTPQIAGYISVNGTKYYAQALFPPGDVVHNVTSTSGQNYTFNWNSAPWSTTGLTNWGYAPTEVTFGIEKRSDAGTVRLYACRLALSLFSAPTPVTPDAPDNLLIETGQDRLDGVTGTASPVGSGSPVPWDFNISADSDYAGITGVKVQVGTSSGASDIWDSDLIQLGDEYDDGDQFTIPYGGSAILQDGVQYFLRMRAYNAYCDESAWGTGVTFYGVTDLDWWDDDYHSRFNVRAGTSHTALEVGHTLPFTMETGGGEVICEYAHVNEGLQHSGRHIIEYDGFLYYTFIGSTTAGGNIKVYVGKKKLSTGVVYDAQLVHTTGTSSDTHYYGTLEIGADKKLHLIIGGHGTQGYYYRSTSAADRTTGVDLTSWATASTPTALQYCTYARINVTSTGTLFVFFRHKEGAYYSAMCYMYSTDNGSNWSARQYVIRYLGYVESPPSIYCGGIQIDGDDRVHILVSWWDSYGSSNKGRALSYIYADLDGTSGKYDDWYELETAGQVGSTTTYASSANVEYSDCSKIATCTNPDTTLSDDFVHSNSEALVVDSDGSPHFVYYEYSTAGTGDETPVFYCSWTGSAWDIEDLYTDESLPKLWKYRQGGQLYYDPDDDAIYIYGFIKPTGETRFGGELYRWRKIIATSSWSGEALSGNSGKGIGMMSVLKSKSATAGRVVLYTRCNALILMEDNYLPLVRYDAADVRVVQASYNGTTVTRTELDRLPVISFELSEAEIEFALATAIAANTNAPTNCIHQVYFGKSNASSPPADPDDVYLYYEGFEAYTSNTSLATQGGWSLESGTSPKVYSADDYTNYLSAHTNKLWGGNKFLPVETLGVITQSIGTDVTDVDVIFHIWGENNYDARGYLELYDATAAKYIRLGFYAKTGSNKATYKIDTASWVDSTTLGLARYYPYRLTVDSTNGVSAYVWYNDTWNALFTNDPTITVFDTLKIGGSASGSYDILFDEIYIRKRVATEPTVVDTEDTAEVFYTEGTGRLANKLQLVHVDTDRLGQIVIPEKTAVDRLMQSLILINQATPRLAHRLALEASDSGRLALALILEAAGTEEIANLIRLEAGVSSRVAQLLIAEAAATGRVGNLLDVEKAEISRVVSKIILEAAADSRLASMLIPDKAELSRLGNSLLPDKAEVARLAHRVLFEGSVETRLANFIQAEATAGTRLGSWVRLEAATTAELANMVLTEAGSFERLAMALKLDDTDVSRLAHGLLADKAERSRVCNAILGDKAIEARLAHGVTVEATDADRIAHNLLADKAAVARLYNGLITEAHRTDRVHHTVHFIESITTRISNLLELAAGDSTRLAQLLQLDDETTTRLCNSLLADKELATRAAHAVLLSGGTYSRVANAVTIEATGSERAAQILNLQASVTDRVAHLLTLEITDSTRLSNTMQVIQTGTDRLAHTVPLAQTALSRLASALLTDKVIAARLMNFVLFLEVPAVMYFGAAYFARPQLGELTVTVPTFTATVTRPSADFSCVRPKLGNVTVRRPRWDAQLVKPE
jgi:hypothetical protein